MAGCIRRRHGRVQRAHARRRHATDHSEPDPPDDIGECYRFQAHDRPVPGDTTPFQVENGEFYSCFFFAVPWPEGSQAVMLRSLDSKLTHHWQLYHTIERYEDGQTTRRAADCGFNLREALGVYSHSEEREQHMPEGVGLQLPPPTGEHGILLEVHYWNPNEPVADTSGVEVCIAKTPRPNTAGVAVLGAAYFTLPPGEQTTVSSTARPRTAATSTCSDRFRTCTRAASRWTRRSCAPGACARC